MTSKLEALPNWTVQIDEISAGVYKLTAVHLLGPSVELTGTNPDKLTDQARESALAIERELEDLRNKLTR
jgi:hypothetical protein